MSEEDGGRWGRKLNLSPEPDQTDEEFGVMVTDLGWQQSLEDHQQVWEEGSTHRSAASFPILLCKLLE